MVHEKVVLHCSAFCNMLSAKNFKRCISSKKKRKEENIRVKKKERHFKWLNSTSIDDFDLRLRKNPISWRTEGYKTKRRKVAKSESEEWRDDGRGAGNYVRGFALGKN